MEYMNEWRRDWCICKTMTKCIDRVSVVSEWMNEWINDWMRQNDWLNKWANECKTTSQRHAISKWMNEWGK